MNPSQIGLGPTYMASFHLSYLFEALISKYSQVLKDRAFDFPKDVIQPITACFLKY